MKTCKWCNASGWFHALTDNGLCKECNLRIVNRVQIHARIISRSLKDLQDTNSLDAKIRLAKRVEEEARALEPFEEKDIETITPGPSDLTDQYSRYHENLVALRKAARDLRENAPVAHEPDITSIGIVDAMDPLGTWNENVALQ